MYPRTRYLAILTLSLVSLVLASPNGSSNHQARDDDGMIMDMDDAMSLASGSMLTYLHFTIGDVLWFQGWVPQNNGAMFGTCFGLFLLALVDRWVAACRAMMEVHWVKRAQLAYTNKLNAEGKRVSPQTVSGVFLMRRSPPFILAHDIVRGVMHAGQAALTFAFMLAVMTFQVGFILSIVIGLGVGEALFGRYARAGVALH